MKSLMMSVLVFQCVTYLILGAYFAHLGHWRLSVCQFLLTIVQFVLYSGGM